MFSIWKWWGWEKLQHLNDRELYQIYCEFFYFRKKKLYKFLEEKTSWRCSKKMPFALYSWLSILPLASTFYIIFFAFFSCTKGLLLWIWVHFCGSLTTLSGNGLPDTIHSMHFVPRLHMTDWPSHVCHDQNALWLLHQLQFKSIFNYHRSYIGLRTFGTILQTKIANRESFPQIDPL